LKDDIAAWTQYRRPAAPLGVKSCHASKAAGLTGRHWLLIASARHLERALTVFVDHYNAHRAHRSLDLAPPNGRPASEPLAEKEPIAVKRRDRLGGLIYEYERAA
jgi:transposase InsO family protein